FVQLLDFVGLDNYVAIFTSPDFWQSLRVTLVFTAFSVVLTVALGFGLALLANRTLGLVPTFRTLIVLPWMTSYMVVYHIFKWILNYDNGLINVALAWSGLRKVGWLTDPKLAMGSLIGVEDAAASEVLHLLRDTCGAPTLDAEGTRTSGIAFVLPVGASW